MKPTYTVLEKPLTITQAAKATGHSPGTLLKAYRTGGLKGCVPHGLKKPRFFTRDLEKWMRGE